MISKNLVIIYSRTGGITLFLFGLLYFLYFKTSTIGLVSSIFGILAFFIPPLIVQFNAILALFFLYICGLSAALYASYETGGITSPVMFWISVTPPVVGLVFTSSKYIVQSAVVVSLIYFFAMFSGHHSQIDNDQMIQVAFFALVGVTSFNAAISHYFHRELWNEKLLVEKQLKQVKMLEAEVVQSEKMATIGLLASGVAHQLGNTLNSISVATITLGINAKAGKVTAKDLEDTLISIKTAVKLSSSIIHGLDYATKRNATNEQLGLHEIVNVAIMLMKGSLLEKTQTKNEVDKQATIFGSKSGLLQVLMNLISNSIDALENNPYGEIIISSSQFGDFEHLLYQDNGPGISNEIADKIFEPFFTTKKADKGTGLGMHIARQELEKMGASIELQQSTVGASFLIKLPIGNKYDA